MISELRASTRAVVHVTPVESRAMRPGADGSRNDDLRCDSAIGKPDTAHCWTTWANKQSCRGPRSVRGRSREWWTQPQPASIWLKSRLTSHARWHASSFPTHPGAVVVISNVETSFNCRAKLIIALAKWPSAYWNRVRANRGSR